MKYKFKPKKSLDRALYRHGSDSCSVYDGDLIDWYIFIKNRCISWNVEPSQVVRWLDAEDTYLDWSETISVKQGWIAAQKFVEQDMSFEDSVKDVWVDARDNFAHIV